MGCDYYVHTEIVIESYNKELINKHETQVELLKYNNILYTPILNIILSYLYHSDNYYYNVNSSIIETKREYLNFDYFDQSDSEEYSENRLNKIIDEINKTPRKILYENDNWIKDKYKNIYEHYIPVKLQETDKIFRIYKRIYAKPRF
jgi:hypothetical protein